MEKAELDYLLIERLQDLDDAARAILAIEERLFNAVDRTVEAWTKAQGWRGRFDFGENSISLWPASWAREDEEPDFYFSLWYGPDDDGSASSGSPYFDVSRFARVNSGSICLWFEPKALRKPAWKKVARANADDFAKLGFHISDYGNFYMPVGFEQLKLAEAVRDDDFQIFLAPLTRALDALTAVAPRLEALARQVQSG
jgi:hypothetical protein